MKYVKLKLSFGDKLKLLFFGLVSEDKLPTNEIIKEVVVEKVNTKPNVPKPPPAIINTNEEEKFHVPFFDLGDEDVNSNF